MTLASLEKAAQLKYICGDLDKEVRGVYTGDLLSWVMSHAAEGNVWVTIMSNINVVAVASLTECACVVFSEDVIPDEEVVGVAREKDVTLLSTALSSYDTCVLLSELLSRNE